MARHESPSLVGGDVLRLLRKYHKRCLVPALMIAALACLYAALKRDTWEASQAMTVRDEVVGGDNQPGKFQLEDEMKAAQETVMELAHSRPVLAAALGDAGPPATHRNDAAGAQSSWPSERDIQDLREALKLAPPKGADFGKTEVFYLKVRDRERPRAIALADRLCNRLEESLGQLRASRAASMIAELTETVALAENALKEANQRLSSLETRIGSNLVELRMLEQSPAGVSDLNRELTESENEVRQARTRQSVHHSILQLLRRAQEDPDVLVSAPTTLFELQPNLKRLADGLVDTQLKTAALAGSMTERHPQVVASRQAEQAIRQRIHNELGLAMHAFEAENELASGRVSYLEGQLDKMRGRMSDLAGLRVQYASLTRDVDHRRALLEAARRDLANVEASQAVAQKCSLINRIGTPDTGARPVGPGRTIIALAGIAAGMLIGLGILFVTVPAPKAVGLSAANGKHAEIEHDLLAPNGHALVGEPWKNRYAGVP